MSDAFWQGEPVPFMGPGEDRGTLEQVAPPLTLEAEGVKFLLLPLEVQRVSGAGGLYLAALPKHRAAPEAQSGAFLGKNVRLLQLEHSEGVITATVVDARLGRPPAATMQPGRSYRFRVVGGRLLELD